MAELTGTEEMTGKCTLRLRSRFLLPTNFLYYVGPWKLDGQLQKGIVRIGIRSGQAIKILGEPDLVEIRCELGGQPLRFASFDQYGS